MKKPKFSKQQEDWLCQAIDVWYLTWKTKITRDPTQPHNLGIAKEAMKTLLILLPDKEKEVDETI